jgi:death-on-curing family protein
VTQQIPVSFVEHIHDVLIGVFLPFDEKVHPSEHRDVGRIESALGRPFHTGMGEEFYPLLSQKGAALFHSLVCNHCFFNGNKRPAVLALDMFLVLNKHILTMPSDAVYKMAKDTAQANKAGISSDVLMADLTQQIGSNIIDVELFMNDGKIKERLGERYDKILTYIKRRANFGITAIESFAAKNLSGLPDE